MTSTTTSPLDLHSLPSDPLERRAKLLSHGTEERIAAAVRYLKSEYVQAELLETCRTFIFSDLINAPRGDINIFKRVGFFPWVEIENEVSEALNQALLGAYKAVYDNCRRALELGVIGAYFQQANVPEEKAREWLRSNENTPPFSRTVDALCRLPRFAELEQSAHWSQVLKDFYWVLCDFVHVRGMKASFRQLQPAQVIIDGAPVRSFVPSRLASVADNIIRTVQHVAAILSAENPVLLVGLDLGKKFGINAPVSGFFEDIQAIRIKAILPSEFLPTLTALSGNDPEVRRLIEYFESLPDLTAAEVREQVAEQRAFWGTAERE